MLYTATLLDGPAADETLDLGRAPIILRAVVSPSGIWDALDQLDDAPKPGETIHVYRLLGGISQPMHFRCTNSRESGYYSFVRYVHHGPQPEPDDDIRSIAGWHEWCERSRKWIIAAYERDYSRLTGAINHAR